MTTPRLEITGEAKLDPRMVLIALTGAIPLFLVAVVLVNVAYSTPSSLRGRSSRGSCRFGRPRQSWRR